jgi:hypothetical protein
MKHTFILLSMILIMTTTLTAIDHLDLMTTLYGEFIGSEFGYMLVSMDFNGDGYDDIISWSPYWNPTGIVSDTQNWGKLYFYWGGPTMDNEPDFVMEGTQNWELFHAGPINAGDINGDGIDDLALTLSIDPTYVMAVYYGTSDPTGVPDLTISIPYEVGFAIRANPLGDINGDGHADLLIFTTPWGTLNKKLLVWTGNDEPFHTLVETNNGTVSSSAIGLGDTNGDNIDDFILQYGIPNGTDMNSRIVLYYGNINYPESDSLVISENTNAITIRSASPLGDLNADGFSDFECFTGRVWFGGIDISQTYDFDIVYNNPYHEWGNPAYNIGAPFIFGDLNGDGNDDIIGSSYLPGYYDGEVGIWVGGSNMDGLMDLRLYPPSDYGSRNYGWSKAAGDFDNDGLCDLAVSAPRWGQGTQYNTTGRVFIYSGNAALADTVVAVDDQTEAEPIWELNIYPNPIHANNQLSINLAGSGFKNNSPLSLGLFDIIGRKVFTANNIVYKHNENTVTFTLPDIPNGIYLLKVNQDNNSFITKKFCVLK